MAQFYGKVKYNGRELIDYQVVNVGNNDNAIIGVGKNITREDSIGDVPLFVNTKKTLPTISITIFKCNRNGEALSITDKDCMDLTRLLYSSDNIGILEIESHNGLVFYGHFVGLGDMFRSSSLQGYVNLKFELASPYAYGSISTNSVLVRGEKTIDIYNSSTATSSIWCDIQIEIEDGDSITIENTRNSQTFTVSGLDKNRMIIVYGQEKEIVYGNDESINLLTLSNMNFKAFNMIYGLNTFKVKGNAKVNFIYQNEIAIY